MSVSGDASPIDPDEAASREFSKARKGFDPTEVRVHLTKLTEEIRHLRATEAELRQQIETARAEPPALDDLDPAAISRALGAETVRIIDTAREASDEIRAKAEENASRVVRDAHDRANRLTRDAAELRENATNEAAELTASTLAETDELLSAARAEAQATLAEAEAEAASLREEAALVLDEKTTEAQLEAVRIRAEADDLRAEAEAYASRRRLEADEEASAVADQALADAEAEVEAARERGREMIREAKEARERMIHDLAERRHSSRQQLEATRAAQERLVEAFAVARDALDDATDGLVDAVPAAREAADLAARSVDEDLDQAVGELDALISAGATTDELIDGPVEPLPALPRSADAVDAHSDLDIALDDDEEDEDDGLDELDVVTFEAAIEPDIDVRLDDDDEDDSETDDRVVAEIVLLEAIAAVGDDDDDDDDDDDEDDDDDDEDEDDEDELTDGSSALDGADTPPLGRLRLVSSNDGEPTPIGLEALVGAAGEGPADDESDEAPRSAEVEELFARLRAGRDDDLDDDDDFDDDDLDDDDDDDLDGGSSGADVTAIGGAVVIDLSTGEPDRSGDADADVVDLSASSPADGLDGLDDPAAAAQQALLDQRDALLGDASQGLSRRVRRVVTDQENEVLDLVRRNRKFKSSVDLLPSREDQLDAYRTAIHKDLREVLSAGADFLSGGADLDDETVERGIDELMAAIGEWGVDPLRVKLARIVDDSDDTSQDRPELVDRLRATYREWRNDRIGELAGDIATLGFSKGVMAAAAPDQQLCWIVDHGGLPCPDGEDNQLAGPVTVGHEFPTGDVCPPAHPGCRCLLVPATR